MWLPRSERFLKFTLLIEVQLQDRPLIFGETIPSSRVQAPIPEGHLVAVDVSGHSTTGREPFLDAVLIAEELVILLGIAHVAGDDPNKQTTNETSRGVS